MHVAEHVHALAVIDPFVLVSVLIQSVIDARSSVNTVDFGRMNSLAISCKVFRLVSSAMTALKRPCPPRSTIPTTQVFLLGSNHCGCLGFFLSRPPTQASSLSLVDPSNRQPSVRTMRICLNVRH